MNFDLLYRAALQNMPNVNVLLFDHNLCYTLVSAQPEPSFHQAARQGQSFARDHAHSLCRSLSIRL